MPKNIFAKFSIFLVIAALLLGSAVSFAEDTSGSVLSKDGYTLEQVVVLSRHNIRSPLSAKGELLDEITPHEWFSWSSAPSELSLRGGILETEMGQFFRKWLEAEGLIPENFRPEGEEVRFYSNSKQRTLATSQYFLAGFLPASNLDVENRVLFDNMDPVFTPQLTFASDIYKEYAEAEIRALFTDKINALADNYALLADVIDMEASEGWKNGTILPFQTDDTEIILNQDEEPAIKGSLKTGCSVADALVLQYYEEPDELKAAFGHQLSFEQWKAISWIKDLYGDVLFTAPLIAVNAAHPLLQEIRSEMDTEGRVFTFLCGHDSNVGSVLAALDAEEYILPDAIESKTPIGCKLVFSKWADQAGESFWGLDLVYQTPEQLRTMPLLTLANPPSVFPVNLNGLERNPDGLYTKEDMLNRLDESINAYDRIVEDFSSPLPTENEIEKIPGWAADSPAMASIISFVSSVTDPESPDYLPPEERIVLFDLDGTLIAERYPTNLSRAMMLQRLLHDGSLTVSDPDDVAYAEAVEEAIRNYEKLPSSPRSTTIMQAEAYAGFTAEEYRAYAREFLKQPVPGFEGMTYGESFFEPMVNLVQYLAEHDFLVYICSGTERQLVRELIADKLGKWIPPYRVIGSIFEQIATGQGDKEGRDYNITADDEMVFSGGLTFAVLKSSKVVAVIDEIGIPPIMVFGNSSGDYSMGTYALENGGRTYILLCDDLERDYGDLEEAAKVAEKCAELGFETVSMRDEFETIFGEAVVREPLPVSVLP